MMLDTAILLQARTGSKRLPGKVLREIKGKPLLSWQVESLKSLEIPIVIATSNRLEDAAIVSVARILQVDYFCGSELDVFSRFSGAVNEFPAERYIRVTGDCPLISPSIIRKLQRFHGLVQSDYASNTLIRSFPDGEDAEIFTRNAFQILDKMAKSSYQTEHPTAGFYQNIGQFDCQNIHEPREMGHWRWTIDYESDFLWLERLLLAMDAERIPEYENIINFIDEHQEFLRTERDVLGVNQV